MVLRVPRNAFRQVATVFDDTTSEKNSRYHYMSMVMYLEMLRRVDADVQKNPQLVNHSPFLKVYLEWVPSALDTARACEYRIHAFFTRVPNDSGEGIENAGNCLLEMLNENEELAFEAANGGGSRRRFKPEKLKEHQIWRKIHKELYLMNICPLATGNAAILNNLDVYLSHGNPLCALTNAAHPINVFTLNHCLSLTADRTPNVKPCFLNPDAYRDGSSYDFPDYSKVIRLTPRQMQPHVFVEKYLPDVQDVVEHLNPRNPVLDRVPRPVAEDSDATFTEGTCAMLPRDQPASPEIRFNRGHMDEFNVATEEEEAAQRLNEFCMRGDFHILRDEAKIQYRTNVAPAEGTAEFTQKYRMYQDWCIMETESRCFTPDSNVSPAVKRIAQWATKRPKVCTIYRTMDPNMSAFGNRVIRMMEEMEQYDMISTAHLSYYIMLHARYDAYRHAKEGQCKMNTFLFGDGACGKSFQFKLLKFDSIPGSVNELTYQTGKSDAIDGNRNSEITIMHEVPPTMFRSKAMGKGVDKSEESRWKEQLTRHKVTVKTFYQDENTGKRGNRTAESECNGVWFGACNQTADDMEEALATRFLKMTAETTVRIGKDIADCQNAMRRMDAQTSAEVEDLRARRREEQYRICVIEHLIWMGAIKDVDETAYHAVIGKFKKVLGGNPQPRDLERIRYMCRIQAMCTALDQLYNLPGGELYGQDFQIFSLPHIEPLLVITEEIVYFTISLLSFMFFSPAEHKVFHALYSCFNSGRKKMRAFQKDGQASNWSYLSCGKLMPLIGEIQQAMPAARGRVPEEVMKAMLVGLSRRVIQSHKFNPPPRDDSDATAPGEWPREKNEGGARTSNPVVIIDREGIHIHVKFLERFRDQHVDPVTDILKRLAHRHSRAKKMLLARRAPNHFHVLTTFQRAAGTAVMEEINVLYNGDISRGILGMVNPSACRSVRKYVYQKDTDVIAYEHRAELLGRAPLDPIELNTRIHADGCLQKTYPDDLIAELGGPTAIRAPSSSSAVAAVSKKAVQTQFVARRPGYRPKRRAEDSFPQPSKRARNDAGNPAGNGLVMGQ
jgi:hypothetical protein